MNQPPNLPARPQVHTSSDRMAIYRHTEAEIEAATEAAELMRGAPRGTFFTGEPAPESAVLALGLPEARERLVLHLAVAIYRESLYGDRENAVHGRAIITAADVAAMRSRARESGEPWATAKEMGAELGVTTQAAYNAIIGRSWSHLEEQPVLPK